jgi:hypothetical protein
MSTVRSVSGLTVDVLKFDPLLTVKYCPFLIRCVSKVVPKFVQSCILLDDELALLELSQSFLPRGQCTGDFNFTHL